MIVKAFAKINLYLNVYPRDESLYHPITSIMQTLNLYDVLTVKENDSKGCNLICDKMTLPPDNTITKVYNKFKEFAEVPGVTVILEKNIPSGAGLAGGSSDGVTFAKALQKITGVKISDEQLNCVAKVIGCDSYYFLRDLTGAAIVSGYGEKILPIKKRELNILLVFPKVHSSTKVAYKLLDDFMANDKNNCKNINYPLAQDLVMLYNSDISTWNFTNSFTQPIASEYTEVQKALNAVKATHPLYYNMTGSGSCVYGVYDFCTSMQKSSLILKNNGWNVHLC